MPPTRGFYFDREPVLRRVAGQAPGRELVVVDSGQNVPLQQPRGVAAAIVARLGPPPHRGAPAEVPVDPLARVR